MATKVKGVPKPKLHPLDKTVYVLIIILSIFLCFVLIEIMNQPGEKLCLSDETVVAYRVNGGKWHIPLCIYCLLVIPFFVANRLYKRVPLFMPLQYAGPRNSIKESPKSKKQIVWGIVALTVGIACAAVAFIPDVERWTLDSEGILREYSSRNELINSYELSPENAKLVEFSTSRVSKSSPTDVKMIVTFLDGTKQYVGLSCFKTPEQAISFMEDFKSGLADEVPVTYFGKFIQNSVNYYGLSASQESRLYALFEMSY